MTAATGASATGAGRPDDGAQWRFTGWMALASILAFFATSFIANGALVYYALSTFSGEEEASPYEHGLAYDREIAAVHAQDARGWRVTIAATRSGVGAPAMLSASPRDADGRPIEGLSVTATMEYPANKAFDQRVSLREVAPGDYRGEARLRAGQWDFVLDAAQGGERRFRSRNRVDLPD